MAASEALFVLTSDLELEPSEPQLSCEVRSFERMRAPCISLHLPVSPCISLYLHVFPWISLDLPASHKQVRSFERMLEAVARQSRAFWEERKLRTP